MTSSFYWLIILAVLIFIEIITLGLTTIWFAAGALTAFIISLFVDNLIVELIVFTGVSLTLLYFVRPLVLQFFNPKKTKTNYEGVIGKEGEVDITIDNLKSVGQVNVGGQEWSARALEGGLLEKGTRVKVQGISGAKLIVSRIYKD